MSKENELIYLFNLIKLTYDYKSYLNIFWIISKKFLIKLDLLVNLKIYLTFNLRYI